MAKIKNKHYKQFLTDNDIDILKERHIEKALKNIKGLYSEQGKALLILLYYTGARPNEILSLTPKDVEKEATYIVVKVPKSKRGLPRRIYLNGQLPLIRQMYAYTRSLFPDMYLFFHYRSNYKRLHQNKKGGIVEYPDVANNLRYYFKLWFKDVFDDPIPPYYLRHSRFSKLMIDGFSVEEIRLFKGSKTVQSVMPYLHMSSRQFKKFSSKIT